MNRPRRAGQRPYPAPRFDAGRPDREAGPAVILRGDDGSVLPINPRRWHADPTPAERSLLRTLGGPLLDIGCGPGRMVHDLARRGIPALGVDPAPGAVALARQRGCAVLQRSVFGPLPGEGRWATVLLMDGNVGIGGDPGRLLRRCRDLARPGGVVVVELQGPGVGRQTCRARLERGENSSAWFEWSFVGADAISDLASEAHLTVQTLAALSPERWFAMLVAPGGARHGGR